MSLIAAAKVTEEEEEEKRQTATEAKSSQITSLCLRGRLFLCVNSGIPVCAIDTLCQTEVIISVSADSDMQSITSPCLDRIRGRYSPGPVVYTLCNGRVASARTLRKSGAQSGVVGLGK